MEDFLNSIYTFAKAMHIASVLAWMAGLFYLPRLFVYHVEAVEKDSETDELFQTMERRLMRAIMHPAMISSWLFGLCLVLTPGIVDWDMVWPWSKGIGILAMTWFHFWLAARRIDFVNGQNTLTGRRYRVMNEFPTLLMLIIVFSVIFRF